MAGAYIIHDDMLAPAASTVSLLHSGAGSATFAATLPGANALDRRLAKVARILRVGVDSTSITTIKFVPNAAPLNNTIQAVCVIGWKYVGVGLGTSFRIRVYQSPSALVYDSGFVSAVQPASYSNASIYIHRLPVTEPTTYPNYTLGWIEVAFRTSFDFGTINDQLDIGRVFVGDMISLVSGVDQDWSLSAVDGTGVKRSRGQQIYTGKMPRFRVGSFKISSIPETIALARADGGTAIGTFQRLIEVTGASGEVLVLPRTSDLYTQNALAIYGVLAKVPVLAHQGGGYYATQLDVEEGL